MSKITPFLWFDTQAEDAMNFYVTVFPNSKIDKVTRWGDGGPVPKGAVMTASFELDGQKFVALNGGPHYKLNEAVSFVIDCKDRYEPRIRDIRFAPASSTLPGSGLGAPDTLFVLPPYRDGYIRLFETR